MDNLSPERRSTNMRQIRAKNSGPEIVLRSLVHRLGYRFRLHRKDLPGKPDLVFPGRRKVIFVHGCFWHQHKGCTEGRLPGTHREYWEPKLARNQERDALSQAALKSLGWGILTLWECELELGPAVISRVIKRFLGPVRSLPVPKRAQGAGIKAARIVPTPKALASQIS